MRRPQLLLASAALLLAAGCSAFVPNSRDELVGRWEGSVLFRSAMTPLVLEVHRGSDSALAGVLSAPELLMFEQPIDSLEWDAPRVRFVAADPSLPLRFEGFARAGRIVGRITSAALPPIERVEALPKASLRRVPVVAAPYESQRVAIEAGGSSLDATLHLPTDSLRHPGIVFVQVEAARRYLDVAALADTFARSGWATLTYESRPAAVTSLDQRVAEAAAAAKWLVSHPRVNGSVGAWGASFAGALAPRVAAEAPLAFVVAVSPPGDFTDEWTGLRVPVLVLTGGRDGQSRVDDRVRAPRQTTAPRGPHVTLHVFPGAGHDLRVRLLEGEPFDWPRAAPGYVDTLLAWTGRAVGMVPAPAPPDTGMPTLNLRPGWR